MIINMKFNKRKCSLLGFFSGCYYLFHFTHYSNWFCRIEGGSVKNGSTLVGNVWGTPLFERSAIDFTMGQADGLLSGELGFRTPGLGWEKGLAHPHLWPWRWGFPGGMAALCFQPLLTHPCFVLPLVAEHSAGFQIDLRRTEVWLRACLAQGVALGALGGGEEVASRLAVFHTPPWGQPFPIWALFSYLSHGNNNTLSLFEA